MSRILIISKEMPYPPHKNGACSTLFNYITCWKNAGHKVKVIYFSPREINAEEHLKERLGVISESLNLTGSGAFTKINKKMIMKPRNSWGIDSRKCPDIDASDFDIVFWGSLATTVIYDKIKCLRGGQVLFAADSLSLYYKRNLCQKHRLLRKLYLFSQKLVAQEYERKIYSTINNVVFVSDVDRKYAAMYFEGNFVANNIGVSIPQEHVKIIDIIEGKKIIDIGFSGIMDYEPNELAVKYIIDKVIPRLEEQGIKYRMHIIGKNPKSEWSETEYYKAGKLLVTGFLDDIEEYISKMDIYISPLFLGTGMKNKILQAMGLGVPIICSEVSAEGIEGLVNGENVIILSDEVDEWVEAICKLAKDVEKRKKFSDMCKKIIQSDYTWEQSAKRVLETNYKKSNLN